MKKNTFIYMDIYFNGNNYPMTHTAANRADMNQIIAEATKDGATKIVVELIINKTLKTK